MTPFAILNISPTDDKMKIRRAYVTEARKHHPDTGGDQEHFKRIVNAYDLLMAAPAVADIIETDMSLSLADFLHGCVATAVLKSGKYIGTMLEFKVPPFTSPGNIIEFYDNSSTNKKIRVKLHELNEKGFTRLDSNIIIEREISVLDAELGVSIDIVNFDGYTYKARVSPGTSADRLIFKHEGAGFYTKGSHTRGDLTIIIKVEKKRYTYV